MQRPDEPIYVKVVEQWGYDADAPGADDRTRVEVWVAGAMIVLYLLSLIF